MVKLDFLMAHCHFFVMDAHFGKFEKMGTIFEG